jgi:hypothetical protein
MGGEGDERKQHVGGRARRGWAKAEDAGGNAP